MLTRRGQCASCGGSLTDVFSMGSMPLANGLLTADQLMQAGESFPLIVAECCGCSLVQLRYVVDPQKLYHDYRFYTGASTPNAGYFLQLANWLKNQTTGRRVLEIGSNDGTLLAALENRHFEVTGVDPAESQCEQARNRLTQGKVICDYWGSRAASGMRGGLFDVVVACNVLGHASDLNDFLSGVRRVIRTNGLFVIEVQYLRSLLGQSAFELIYHEHVSYFDETSLSAALALNGFKVLGWQTTDSQCGTLRMWASGMGGGTAIEATPHDWLAFRDGITERHSHLLETIATSHAEGRRVGFYGAPAKATQIANYWRLGTESIQFATDTTPAKQGCFIPGALIPVVPPSHLEPTDAAIVAAWNHWPFIARQEAAFVAAGGKLINPALTGVCP